MVIWLLVALLGRHALAFSVGGDLGHERVGRELAGLEHERALRNGAVLATLEKRPTARATCARRRPTNEISNQRVGSAAV